MKRHLAITAVMLLCSAVFFVVVSAGAGPVVPWKGTWEGGSNFIIPATNCPDGFNILAIATGKGNMTLGGASEWISTNCCEPTGHCVGTAIITTANGDQIYLSLTHDFNPVSGDWIQNEEIIGGTGRFVGATGESMSSGTSTVTGPTTDIWQGTNVGSLEFSF